MRKSSAVILASGCKANSSTGVTSCFRDLRFTGPERLQRCLSISHEKRGGRQSQGFNSPSRHNVDELIHKHGHAMPYESRRGASDRIASSLVRPLRISSRFAAMNSWSTIVSNLLIVCRCRARRLFKSAHKAFSALARKASASRFGRRLA